MPRLLCPNCRFPFAPRAGNPAPRRCPRCEAAIPRRCTVDANTWLASTVLAELRASGGKGGRTPGAPARRADPARVSP